MNGEGNAIAWNDVGVYNYGVRNAIRGNPIFFNGSIGIDNDPAGVTPNDARDADTGANELQNFPFISSVDYGSTSLTAHGILKSTPNVTFDLDFYESPSCTPHPRDLLQSAYYIGSTRSPRTARATRPSTPSSATPTPPPCRPFPSRRRILPATPPSSRRTSSTTPRRGRVRRLEE